MFWIQKFRNFFNKKRWFFRLFFDCFFRKIELFFSLKVKSRNCQFWNFFSSTFLCELKILWCSSFVTPHGSENLTSVKFFSPLFAKNSRLGYFFNAKSPQGGSDYTEIVSSIFLKFRFASPQGGSYNLKLFTACEICRCISPKVEELE